ncbi:MAG: TlpA family protein disulfide reductase [Lysobacter sp.]|nr:TlpA family protein disulfide reductase [Lysobacter sp.]
MSARPPSPARLRACLWAALLALVCLGAVFPATADEAAGKASAQAPQVGDRPPEWLGLDDQGRSLRVGQYRGKVLLVVFWAGWCEQCRRELPQLSALQTGVGRERLQIVAINYAEPQADYEAFLRRNPGLNLTTIRDPGTVARHYRVRAVPNAFLIDTQGRIAYVQRGYTPAKVERLVRELHALLPPIAQSPAPAPAD